MSTHFGPPTDQVECLFALQLRSVLVGKQQTESGFGDSKFTLRDVTGSRRIGRSISFRIIEEVFEPASSESERLVGFDDAYPIHVRSAPWARINKE
ncbi:protein of unknown function (plasmid) [Pararobbsia alpina]